jgi:hypothetical protein
VQSAFAEVSKMDTFSGYFVAKADCTKRRLKLLKNFYIIIIFIIIIIKEKLKKTSFLLFCYVLDVIRLSIFPARPPLPPALVPFSQQPGGLGLGFTLAISLIFV